MCILSVSLCVLADIMYNGEMNEKIKLLYRLHIPPGKKDHRENPGSGPSPNLNQPCASVEVLLSVLFRLTTAGVSSLEFQISTKSQRGSAWLWQKITSDS